MVYLARKITCAKWESREGFAAGGIPADAVTADLRTTGNTLSFWKCEPPPDDGIGAVVLGLATGAARIDWLDLVWVEEDSRGPDSEPPAPFYQKGGYRDRR
jgi:hypothetical protein